MTDQTTTPEPRQIFIPDEAVDAAVRAAAHAEVALSPGLVELMLTAADKHLGWQYAGRSTVWAVESLLRARSLSDQATAVEQATSAVSDLSSWLDGYDARTGEVRDPNGDDE